MSPNDNPLLTAAEQKQLIQNVLDEPDDIFGVYSRRLLDLHDEQRSLPVVRHIKIKKR